MFDSEEIIKLIKGVDKIDTKELEKSARYVGCSPSEEHIKWFWEIVHGMTQEEKKKFLMFTSGSDRSPLRGLSQLAFTITGTGLDDTRLPSAHTCFNDLILPKYSTKDLMRTKLMQALENYEGFGLM